MIGYREIAHSILVLQEHTPDGPPTDEAMDQQYQSIGVDPEAAADFLRTAERELSDNFPGALSFCFLMGVLCEREFKARREVNNGSG